MAEKIQGKPELCGALEAQRKKDFKEGTGDSGFRSCSVSRDRMSTRPVVRLWGATESSFSKVEGQNHSEGGEREQRQRLETILQGTHVCACLCACPRVRVSVRARTCVQGRAMGWVASKGFSKMGG